MPDLARIETPVAADTTTPSVPAPRSARSSRYPSIASKALLAAAHVQTARWDFALRHVEAEQMRILRGILRHAAHTELGRKHAFASIRSYEQLAARVPVADYDAFSPYIERMRAGEAGLLVPEKVQYFGNSSGSSRQGRGKFLPISERQIAQQRLAGSEILARYLAHVGDDTFLNGFTLGLFPPTTMRAEGPTFVTSNPALMVTRMPLVSRPVFLPDEDIKQMSDYEAKLRVIAARYLDHEVHAITGTTCWFPLLLERVLEAAAARGRPARCVDEIWPELRVLIGGGVSAAPYLPMLRRLIGRDVTLIDSYNATEGGIYAASDQRAADGLLVLPHRGTFFEFAELGTTTRVPLWGVELGREYSIIVTTLSGLYAYELGDIVRFTSLAPLRMAFSGRLAGCLSLTQELTTHIEIEQAVAQALQACGGRSVEFGAAADVGASGAKSRYVVYVEFDVGAEPHDLSAFAAEVDAGLCRVNRVYREHRAGEVALLPARVERLPRGAAQRFLEKTTQRNVQGKFPRILDAERHAQFREHLSIPSD
jgi:hypothetical protein